MIINKLTLNNFMCYYSLKSFEFANGLNLILGHNGDGKSTIFRAFNWIFDQFSQLNLSEIYSKKRYHEILENDVIEVSVECVITQFNEEFKIIKLFSVTKSAERPIISSVKEEIWRKDLTTGENSIDSRTVSILSQQVFPEAFRNFSMFETETDALNIVEGTHLAELVKNFSNARHYDKLDEVIESFSDRADKQFRRESKSDIAAQDAITEIDNNILTLKGREKRLLRQIEEDEKGRDYYSDKTSELVRNFAISDEYKKIESQIEILNSEIDKAKQENRGRTKFTDNLFDKFHILYGFDKIVEVFAGKINVLRQEKNKVDDLERSRYAKEKLELDNLSTPLPPGFPSLDILREILEDDICKICNTAIQSSSREYINKSIQLYEESRKTVKAFQTPTIFVNNFIDELQIVDRAIQLKPDLYSTRRIQEEIDFSINRSKECNNVIVVNNEKLESLEVLKKDLLGRVQNLSEAELKNIVVNFENYRKESDGLIAKISENKTKYKSLITEREDFERRRINTLSQFKDSDFKKATVEVLNLLSSAAKNVKDDEYNKFMNQLSERATNYLKKINIGEITGRIELYKNNNNEVLYKSLNDDNSVRSSLEDSGALQISKPLSILFAIADIASETAENETYPMIFDAPTGRFSPDREKEFFKVLKHSNKQRIVVTLRFLGVDKFGNPFVNKELFEDIEKDKAFFIKRSRPYNLEQPETINTEVEVI